MNENTVRDIQNKLRFLSKDFDTILPIAVDGIFGEETERALAELQRILGFDATGEADERTLNALNDLYRAASEKRLPAVTVQIFPINDEPLVLGSTGVSQTVLNIMLGALAFVFSNLPKIQSIDTFGEDTLEAVAIIQHTSGLTTTGQVDKPTWNMIARLFNEYRGGNREI